MNYDHATFLEKIYQACQDPQPSQDIYNYVFDYTEDLFQNYLVNTVNTKPVVELMNLVDFSKLNLEMLFIFISRFKLTQKDVPEWVDFAERVEKYLSESAIPKHKIKYLNNLIKMKIN